MSLTRPFTGGSSGPYRLPPVTAAAIQGRSGGVWSEADKYPQTSCTGPEHGVQGPRRFRTRRHGQSRPVRTEGASAVHTSPIVPRDGPVPERDEPRIRPAHDPPPGRADDPAEVIPLPAQDHDRIAARDINDIVMDRLFFAGLALETALGGWAAIRKPGRSGKPSASWTWRSGMSGTSCSITISLIRRLEGSRARAVRALPGARRPLLCRFPARRRPTPGAGENVCHTSQQGPYRRVGHPVEDRPVQARAQGGERRPVDPGQR